MKAICIHHQGKKEEINMVAILKDDCFQNMQALQEWVLTTSNREEVLRAISSSLEYLKVMNMDNIL